MKSYIFVKMNENNVEIKNMINCHILDGIALTKFIGQKKNRKSLLNFKHKIN